MLLPVLVLKVSCRHRGMCQLECQFGNCRDSARGVCQLPARFTAVSRVFNTALLARLSHDICYE